MKLSEAIRLGATVSPQHFGSYADGNGGTCALGSAALAIGIDPIRMDISDDESAIDDAFPALGRYSRCPAHGCLLLNPNAGFPVGVLIPHLNDRHRWTREQIADWVQTIEDAREIEEISPLDVIEMADGGKE